METTETRNERGALALAIVVLSVAVFAWNVADYNTPLPNGAMPNKSAEQLGLAFMGVVSTMMCATGAMLGAWRLRRNQKDRFARAALLLGLLTMFGMYIVFRVWFGEL